MSQTTPQRRFFKRPQSKPETIVLKPKQAQFPSISLNIPELTLTGLLLHPVFLTAFTCGFLFMSVGIVGFDIRQNMKTLQTVRQDRQVVLQQEAYWKGITEKYPGYRDALYQLAVLEYRLGNIQAAYLYGTKSLEIDPAFNGAKDLLSKLVAK